MEIEQLEKIREFFRQDRFATENGAIIDEVGKGYAVCSLTLTDRHRNALGGVMGAASFMLADFAFAVATNWENPGVVSLSSNITFLGAAKGERLIAKATCVKDGRSTGYYQIQVDDDLGNPVAAVVASSFVKR